MRQPFYAEQQATRLKILVTLYPLGIPANWIAEKLGISQSTLQKDIAQLSQESVESRPRIVKQVFQKVLREYTYRKRESGPEALKMKNLLGGWLEIDSITRTFKTLDTLMNNLSYPSLLPEHKGYAQLLKAIFGEKHYPYEECADAVWGEYLSRIGTIYTECHRSGRYAGINVERSIPFPDNFDGLESGFLAYFTEEQHKNIGPLWSKDTPSHIEAVLETLSPREARVIKMRFGLNTGKSPQTLAQIAAELEVSNERPRQIEAKALRKLRHPSRSYKLRHLIRLEPIYWSPAQNTAHDKAVETEQAMLARITTELESIPVADRLVETLEVSVRTANCLKNGGIKTIGQLAAKSMGELLRTQNFGRKSLNELKDILDDLGVTSKVRAGW